MNQLPFDETPADESKPTPNPPQPLNSLPELLTIRELARALKLSPRSLWRLVRKQQLPAPFRIGGSIRWRVVDVSQWIAKGCNQTTDTGPETTSDRPLSD